MRNSLTYIFFFLCLLAFNVYGQSDPLLRIELDVKSDEATYKIAPCDDKGAILFYETTMHQNDYQFWSFILFNKYMQESWRKDMPIFHNLQFSKKILTEDNLYVLFHDSDMKKSEVYNYQILKIDLIDGNYELFSGVVPDDSKFEDFDVIGEFIVVGMNGEENKSGIYAYHNVTNETKSIYEPEIKQSRFEDLYIDTVHQTMLGVFNIYVSKNKYYLLFKEFDTLGNEIATVKIVPEQGKKFNSAKIVNGKEGERLVFGTYDIIKGKTIDEKDYFYEESSGFYAARISNGEHVGTVFHNFLDLENMTGYLKSKEYQDALKKAEKSEDGKDKHSIGFDLILHDIVITDSLYYFIAEAFYEEYHTVTNTYYDYYGHAMPVSYAVFDGYKYFNAFIACFDESGNKLWDNGMEIFNILTFNLKKRVNVYFEKNDIIMAYNREGKIGAKIINGRDVIEGVEYYPIETTYLNDKIMEDSKSNMEPWYDNYFIAYGFQTIKNNSLLSNNKRTIFYINKVAFQ